MIYLFIITSLWFQAVDKIVQKFRKFGV